jgi:CRISPR-associated RAMP protein (TIGR02581 family)
MLEFDRLINRYVIRARLQAEGALHIGTGVADVNTDAPFIRMGNAAYIPGSSLRGVLRSTAERLWHAIRPGQGYCISFQTPDGACDTRIDDSRHLETKANQHTLQFCPMCRFFGSTAIASRFKITDAVQFAGKLKEPVRRDGVGIDRDTETARDQIKYDFETLEPGCGFEITMQVENAGDQDKAILYMLLVEMKNGVDVGGKRSRGLGRIVLQPGYAVQYFDEDGDYKLLSYLREGTLKTQDAGAFEGDLRAAFDRFTAPGMEGLHAA